MSSFGYPNEDFFNQNESQDEFFNDPDLDYDITGLECFSQIKNEMYLQLHDTDPPSDEFQMNSGDESSIDSEMNFQHGKKTSTFIDNPKKTECSFSTSRKVVKQKITLKPKAQYLKNHYYIVFTKKKKFSKILVKRIHKIIQEPLKLGPFTRKMTRFNDIYFQENANNCEKILAYLVNNKDSIIEQIPELSKLQ